VSALAVIHQVTARVFESARLVPTSSQTARKLLGWEHRSTPDIGQQVVAVAGNEQLLAAIRLMNGTFHRADVTAVDVDADRDTVLEGIADLMDVTDGGRHAFDLTALEP